MQETKKVKQSIVKKFKQRFSINNIKDQHHYIKHMNKDLQISIKIFQSDPFFHPFNVRELLRETSFFRLQGDKARLVYPNEDRTVFITGIHPPYIHQFVKEFQENMYQVSRTASPISNQPSWSTIQFNSFQSAKYFQKFARNKKRQLDNEGNIKYKIEKKRVRIVIMKDDFFTIITDIMNEQQSKRFTNAFGKENLKGLTYLPLNIGVSYSAKEQEVEDTMSEEMKSKSSDIYDSSKIEELIETKNQGSQYEKIQEIQDWQKTHRVKTVGVGVGIGENIEGIVAEQSQKTEDEPKKEMKQAIETEEKTQNVEIQKYPFIQMKKKYEEHRRKDKRKEYDIPDYIKREPEYIVYKKKFFNEVVRSANKVKIHQYS